MLQFLKFSIPLIILFILLGTDGIKAQSPKDLNFRKTSAKEGARRMAQKFALTSQQAHVLDSINVRFEEDLYAANMLVQKERTEVLKKLFPQRERDLKALFTKEQFDAYIRFKETNRRPLKVTRKYGKN